MRPVLRKILGYGNDSGLHYGSDPGDLPVLYRAFRSRDLLCQKTRTGCLSGDEPVFAAAVRLKGEDDAVHVRHADGAVSSDFSGEFDRVDVF